MAPLETTARRVILACGFALAVAAAPAVAAVAVPATPGAPVAACPSGEEEDLYTDEACRTPCPIHRSPRTQPTPTFRRSTAPCTGRNSGQCIGLAEDAVPNVQPESTVGSSPTVYGNSEAP
jgi:hypothetical protein